MKWQIIAEAVDEGDSMVVAMRPCAGYGYAGFHCFVVIEYPGIFARSARLGAGVFPSPFSRSWFSKEKGEDW